MPGGLFDPLGHDRSDRIGKAAPSVPLIASVIVLVLIAGVVIAAMVRDTGDRGQPVAVSPIEHVQSPTAAVSSDVGVTPKVAPGVTPTAPPANAPVLPAVRDDQEVEIQNGVRIIRPRRSGTGSTGQTTLVPAPSAQTATPDPRPGAAATSAKP